MKYKLDVYSDDPLTVLEKKYDEGWSDCYETYKPELKHLRQENEALRGLIGANIRVSKLLEV